MHLWCIQLRLSIHLCDHWSVQAMCLAHMSILILNTGRRMFQQNSRRPELWDSHESPMSQTTLDALRNPSDGYRPTGSLSRPHLASLPGQVNNNINNIVNVTLSSHHLRTPHTKNDVPMNEPASSPWTLNMIGGLAKQKIENMAKQKIGKHKTKFSIKTAFKHTPNCK